MLWFDVYLFSCINSPITSKKIWSYSYSYILSSIHVSWTEYFHAIMPEIMQSVSLVLIAPISFVTKEFIIVSLKSVAKFYCKKWLPPFMLFSLSAKSAKTVLVIYLQSFKDVNHGISRKILISILSLHACICAWVLVLFTGTWNQQHWHCMLVQSQPIFWGKKKLVKKLIRIYIL